MLTRQSARVERLWAVCKHERDSLCFRISAERNMAGDERSLGRHTRAAWEMKQTTLSPVVQEEVKQAIDSDY
jgi:hypothetical protein